MLNLRLVDIARYTGGHLHGADALVSAVATDSRRAGPGMLFVALAGEQRDGHDFIVQAQRDGAVAALVERLQADVDMTQIVVGDTLLALGELARAVREQRTATVVGITGSNGKTTVKSLLAAVLARHGRTHVNAGNYNNEIGLPLTLLAMPDDAQFAVFEMGAGKPGDIAYLARIAQPRIGLVNNVAPAHLERMGSLEGVAQTKGAIYAALPDDGIAVINADDAFADFFIGLAGPRRTLTFGLDRPADVGAHIEPTVAGTRIHMRTPAGDIDVELPLHGRHNVMNALAAAAIAHALAVPLETIRAGLQDAAPVAGRQQRRLHPSGALIIDDSYNANPASFAAAIATLAAESGERVLVMGDMGELGADARSLHAQVGAMARTSGIEQLHAVGALSAAAVDAFGARAVHHVDQAALIASLRAQLRAGVCVLVKGSRSAGMERVVNALFNQNDTQPGERHAA